MEYWKRRDGAQKTETAGTNRFWGKAAQIEDGLSRLSSRRGKYLVRGRIRKKNLRAWSNTTTQLNFPKGCEDSVQSTVVATKRTQQKRAISRRRKARQRKKAMTPPKVDDKGELLF